MLTPKFRINWPALLKPELRDKNKPEKGSVYRVDAIYPLDADLSALRKAALQCIIDEFGQDEKKWPANLHSPFRDQKEFAKDGVLPEGYVAGAILMKYKTDEANSVVGVVDGTKGNQSVIAPSEIYSGRWAIADVTPKYYNYENMSKGVTFYLNHVQLWEHDEPLSGRQRVEAVFKPVAQAAGSNTASNPFA
jgi:hypothetical protein